MNNFEKLYTIEDIAKMTRLTSRTIRNYLKDGILEGKKIGGQWRFTMK
ncbi:helix-turn-helix domain-containing protein, partial (plasmid) [Clostridium perfringens]